jgi:hypothetical protein
MGLDLQPIDTDTVNELVFSTDSLNATISIHQAEGAHQVCII